MIKTNIVTHSILAIALVINIQTAHANHLTTCPSVDTLKTFSFAFAVPYAYNKQDKSVHFITFAVDEAVELGLIMSPVAVSFTGDPKTNMQAMIAKLQPETSTPIQYRLVDDNDLILPMCVYSMSDNQNVSVMLFSDESDSCDTDFHMCQHNISKAEKARKFMKFINLP